MACPYHPRAGTQPAILPACLPQQRTADGYTSAGPTTKAQRQPTHTGTPTNECLTQTCTHRQEPQVQQRSTLHKGYTKMQPDTHKTRLVQRSTATRGGVCIPCCDWGAMGQSYSQPNCCGHASRPLEAGAEHAMRSHGRANSTLLFFCSRYQLYIAS